MLDDLRSDGGAGGLDGQHKRPVRKQDADKGPMADREVPLAQHEPESRVLAPAIHEWLDGELPEASIRKGELSRDVEFWKRLNTEADRRRHLRTPANLEARIMEALPHTAPQIITPWWRREFVITPVAALATAAALAVVAATAGGLLISPARRPRAPGP